MLYSRSLLLTYFIYIIVCVYVIPSLPVCPTPSLSLDNLSLFSASVTLSVDQAAHGRGTTGTYLLVVDPAGWGLCQCPLKGKEMVFKHSSTSWAPLTHLLEEGSWHHGNSRNCSGSGGRGSVSDAEQGRAKNSQFALSTINHPEITDEPPAENHQ